MKVGKDVLIDTDDFLGYDLIEIKDGATMDVFCGITAVTFTAGKPSDKFPSGKMTIKRASVGAGAVVGAAAMVVCADVPDGGVVKPCTASNNPPAVWKGTRWPQSGPDAVTAAKTQGKPLGVLSGLMALLITDVVIGLIATPFLRKYEAVTELVSMTASVFCPGGLIPANVHSPSLFCLPLSSACPLQHEYVDVHVHAHMQHSLVPTTACQAARVSNTTVPAAVGLLFFWAWLSNYHAADLQLLAGEALQCFTQLPSHPSSPEAAADCNILMVAALKTMLLYPPIVFITGEHASTALIMRDVKGRQGTSSPPDTASFPAI